MLCSTFYHLHQELETLRMGKYKKKKKLICSWWKSSSLSIISMGQLFLANRGVKGREEWKRKAKLNALENFLKNTISIYFSISVPTDLIGTNLFLIPPSNENEKENENNRCDGQWTYLRQAGEENGSFLITCSAPSLPPTLYLYNATPVCERGTVTIAILMLCNSSSNFTDELV